MTFEYPAMIAVTVVVCGALGLAYRVLHRRRAAALAAAGLAEPRRSGLRRHLPPVLFLAALALLLVGAARPQATVKVPHAAGTVILAFDVSNSMTATDVSPSRLAAAQASATKFVQAQPGSVDIGIVAFDQGALTSYTPSSDHDRALAAIKSLHPSGGTSIGQAILASLSAIVGHTVTLPADGASPPPLGYWGSATIVLLSDGENTGGPDPLGAAGLAADAGVRIETVGVGTAAGTTITVDGYQVATALNQDLLTQIAQTTAGSYHEASDAASLDSVYKSLDLRITSKAESLELTGAAVILGVLLLTLGGLLTISWFGRIL